MAERGRNRKLAGLLLVGVGGCLVAALARSTSMARANNPIVLREAMTHCAKVDVGDDVATVRRLGQITGAEIGEVEDRIELRYRRPYSDRMGCIAYVENGKVRQTYVEDFPPEFPGEFDLP